MIYRLKKVFSCLLFLVLCLPAWALSAPVGTLTRAEGGVDILNSDSTTTRAANAGDHVSKGDIIRTKRTGIAEIRFLDDSVVQLAPESRMRIDDYAMGPGNTRKMGLLNLFRGKIRALVSKVKTAAVPVSSEGTGSSFNIRTRTAIAGVKGSRLIVFSEKGVSGAIFLDGHGFLYNPKFPNVIVPLSKGQASFILGDDKKPAAPIVVSTGRISNSFNQPASGSSSEQSPSATTVTVTETVTLQDVAGAGVDPNTLPTSEGWQYVPVPDKVIDIPIVETVPKLVATPVKVNVTIPR